LTAPDIFMESRTDFSADIGTKFPSLSESQTPLTLSLLISLSLLCALSQ